MPKKTGQTIAASDFVIATTAGEALSARDSVYISTADGKAYKTDADDTTKLSFMGFAQEAASLNAAVNVIPDGFVGGFSGLTAGARYYLSGTAGAITTTPGATEVAVGIAINTTTILIMRGLRRASGTQALSTTVSNQSITTNFRPGVVRITAYYIDNDSTAADHSEVHIVWTPNSTSSAGFYLDEGNGAVIVNDATLRSASGSYVTIGVASITATGFTLTLAESGTFNGQATLVWEAEGEI